MLHSTAAGQSLRRKKKQYTNLWYRISIAPHGTYLLIVGATLSTDWCFTVLLRFVRVSWNRLHDMRELGPYIMVCA